jgi:hypothetical protein
MFNKNFSYKATLSAFTILSTCFTLNAKAGKWEYVVGGSIGIGHFEYNQSDSVGNSLSRTATAVNGSAPILRSTYKYIDNNPKKTFNIEAGMQKKLDGITLGDFDTFAGFQFNVGTGKMNATNGITNPNGTYMSTGSTAMFYSLSAKFGLEKKDYKLYGIGGLTYVKTDLPFDILPYGNKTLLGDLATCTALAASSPLAGPGINMAAPAVGGLIGLVQADCAKLKVGSFDYSSFFLNIGFGAELNVYKNAYMIWEVMALRQLFPGKEFKTKYTYNGNPYEFKGKIGVLNTQFIKIGFRYYFV